VLLVCVSLRQQHHLWGRCLLHLSRDFRRAKAQLGLRPVFYISAFHHFRFQIPLEFHRLAIHRSRSVPEGRLQKRRRARLIPHQRLRRPWARNRATQLRVQLQTLARRREIVWHLRLLPQNVSLAPMLAERNCRKVFQERVSRLGQRRQRSARGTLATLRPLLDSTLGGRTTYPPTSLEGLARRPWESLRPPRVLR